ncbi:hypothetical protein BD779DRAFT_1474683 [Infundibulicybe gibba]|nr:hypothetical protein BD779DRAFT_1474683 [Infundibulicybe gibba]
MRGRRAMGEPRRAQRPGRSATPLPPLAQGGGKKKLTRRPGPAQVEPFGLCTKVLLLLYRGIGRLPGSCYLANSDLLEAYLGFGGSSLIIPRQPHPGLDQFFLQAHPYVPPSRPPQHASNPPPPTPRETPMPVHQRRRGLASVQYFIPRFDSLSLRAKAGIRRCWGIAPSEAPPPARYSPAHWLMCDPSGQLAYTPPSVALDDAPQPLVDPPTTRTSLVACTLAYRLRRAITPPKNDGGTALWYGGYDDDMRLHSCGSAMWRWISQRNQYYVSWR